MPNPKDDKATGEGGFVSSGAAVAGAHTNRSTKRTDVQKARPFVLQWRSAVVNATLPASRKLTLLVLAEFAGVDGASCHPSVESIAWHADQNERTVRRGLKDGEANGWLKRSARGVEGALKPHGWKLYSYTLTIPDGADCRPARQFRRPDTAPARRGAKRPDTQPASRETSCGLSVHDVRTLTPERAGAESDELALDLGEGIREELPATPAAAHPLWNTLLEEMVQQGENQKQARTVIGVLLRNLRQDEQALVELHEQAKREHVARLLPWLMKASLQARKPRGAKRAPAPIATFTDDDAERALEDAKRWGNA